LSRRSAQRSCSRHRARGVAVGIVESQDVGAGIPAFFTPAGAGTLVAEGKEVREFDGRQYLLERALSADFAIIKAWKGDRLGNLIYRKTARNFGPIMATAAALTIVQVETIDEAGALDPEAVVTPGIFVDRLVACPTNQRVPA